MIWYPGNGPDDYAIEIVDTNEKYLVLRIVTTCCQGDAHYSEHVWPEGYWTCSACGEPLTLSSYTPCSSLRIDNMDSEMLLKDASATLSQWIQKDPETTPIEVSVSFQTQTCGRHGGVWGDDETCVDCTDRFGNVRPYSSA